MPISINNQKLERKQIVTTEITVTVAYDENMTDEQIDSAFYQEIDSLSFKQMGSPDGFAPEDMTWEKTSTCWTIKDQTISCSYKFTLEWAL